MTLIAHSTDPPFFTIGDVLISSKEKIAFVPPVVPIDVSQFLNEENRTWYPCELRRKIYILKQNLVVAFSGDYYEIRQFLKELRIQCAYHDAITVDNVQQILREYDFTNMFKKSSFFMIHINNVELTATVMTMGYWDSVDNEIYHEMFANGSGAEGYLYWLNEKINSISSHPEGDVNRLIQMNCAFIAKLFSIERHTRATIRDNWGAGFELIFHTGKNFVKHDEIAYVIFEAKFNTDGSIDVPYPVNIMYYKYHEEVLVITSIDVYGAHLEETGDDFVGLCHNIEARVYPVLPLDVDENEIDKSSYAKNVSFTTFCVARGLVLNKNDYVHSITSFFNRGLEIKVEFDQLENNLKIVMHKFVVQEMKDIAKGLFHKF